MLFVFQNFGLYRDSGKGLRLDRHPSESEQTASAHLNQVPFY